MVGRKKIENYIKIGGKIYFILTPTPELAYRTLFEKKRKIE